MSSIYLPSTRLPLIPSQFTEQFCSLQQNKVKKSIRIDFKFFDDGTEIVDDTDNFEVVDVFIDQNFVYEDDLLLNNVQFKTLLKFTQFIEPSTKDSHELVSFWMIKANKMSAKLLRRNQNGIFRKISARENFKTDIFGWNVKSSQYVLFNMDDDNNYTHATSPIRRIVDLLNQIFIHKNISSNAFSERANNFICMWLSKIPFINTSMKSIRKVQFDCNLLNYFHNKSNISERTYIAIVVEKEALDFGFYTYTVFLSDLNFSVKVSKCSNGISLKYSNSFALLFTSCIIGLKDLWSVIFT